MRNMHKTIYLNEFTERLLSLKTDFNFNQWANETLIPLLGGSDEIKDEIRKLETRIKKMKLLLILKPYEHEWALLYWRSKDPEDQQHKIYESLNKKLQERQQPPISFEEFITIVNAMHDLTS